MADDRTSRPLTRTAAAWLRTVLAVVIALSTLGIACTGVAAPAGFDPLAGMSGFTALIAHDATLYPGTDEAGMAVGGPVRRIGGGTWEAASDPAPQVSRVDFATAFAAFNARSAAMAHCTATSRPVGFGAPSVPSPGLVTLPANSKDLVTLPAAEPGDAVPVNVTPAWSMSRRPTCRRRGRGC